MGLSLERHLDEAMAAKEPGDGFSAREVADTVDATYRQIDYWTRVGVFRSSIAEARGSGSRRRYNEADVEIAFALVDLFRLRLDTDLIGQVVELLRRRRVDPGGEWLVVPVHGEPVRARTLGQPDTIPTPSVLIRLRSYVIVPAGGPSDSTAGDPAGTPSRGAA